MRGFSLMEIIVATFLLTVVLGGAFTFLSFGIRVQGDSLGSQVLIDETSFVAEYMSRAMRQAKKDTGVGCITSGFNYELVSASEIKFLDKDGICRIIKQTTSAGYGIIEEDKGTGTFRNLTGPDIDVLEFRFELEGETQADDIQPRATFFIHAISRTSNAEIYFQTTVSQRDFDVEE